MELEACRCLVGAGVFALAIALGEKTLTLSPTGPVM
jgi:hypothetical protein